MSRKSVDTIEEIDNLNNCNLLFAVSHFYERGATVGAIIGIIWGLATGDIFWGSAVTVMNVASIFLVCPVLENRAFLLKTANDINERLREAKKEKH